MNRKKKFTKKSYIYLGGILTVGFLVYLAAITKSGLWYDEAIEYFYSRYILGEVPGGLGGTNMYERICITYQPPLYNFLMYIWLLLFDSEFGFRLAGISVTLLGAIGMFKAVDAKVEDGVWANISALLYLFTSSIAYYGLECAEYNLMLSCISWMLYFYICALKKMSTSSLIGFFVFASLSVYSQYGAAFLVAGMFITLVIEAIKNHDKKLIKNGMIITVITGAVAVFPLFYFFLFPQMKRQGSAAISHMPVFVENPAIDYIRGLSKTLKWLFSEYSIEQCKTGIWVAIAFSIILTLAVLRKKDKVLSSLISSFLLTWTFYFVAVACSLYGYNSWSGKRGIHNIGGRYALFLAPIVLLILVIGVREFLNEIKSHQKAYRTLALAGMIGVAVFCGIEAYKIDVVGWKKDDIREVTDSWYKCGAYESQTLVHQWDDAMFHFYFMHDDEYEEGYRENVEVAGWWSRTATADTMEAKLTELGYFDLPEFYYVTPVKSYAGSYKAFREVMDMYGYQVEEIYVGNSALLYVNKR